MVAQTILTAEEFTRAAQACEKVIISLEDGEVMSDDVLGGLDGILVTLAAQPFPADDASARGRAVLIESLIARRTRLV